MRSPDPPPMPSDGQRLSPGGSAAVYNIKRSSYFTLLRGPLTSIYGSSCANNGKDALNTPEC
eukprot:1587146-Pyramimonas_sp.AAC.1